MRIEQLMHKDVGSVTPAQTLNDAAQVLWERDCGCVPVVSEDGARRVIAMLTDRDICMAAYTQGRSLHEIPVGAAMSPEVIACSPGDSVEDAEAILRKAQVRRLPVADEAGQLVGIVSLADVAIAAERCRGQKHPALDEAEVAATLATICQPRHAPPEAGAGR
jgi:CBS-domain-containing membrane protein